LLVIIGEWRWDSDFGYIPSTVTVQSGGSITTSEKDHGDLRWDFTRVENAVWK
jgi:hypothetical protein